MSHCKSRDAKTDEPADLAHSGLVAAMLGRWEAFAPPALKPGERLDVRTRVRVRSRREIEIRTRVRLRTESAESAKPVEPAGSAAPIEPAESVKPVKPVKSTKPVKSVKSVKPAKPVEPLSAETLPGPVGMPLGAEWGRLGTAGVPPARLRRARNLLDTLKVDARRVDHGPNAMVALVRSRHTDGRAPYQRLLERTRRTLLKAAIGEGGRLACCPYAGGPVEPVRRVERTGVTRRVDVNVDHVVSLADAWASGAWRFDEAHMAAFACDPHNLAVVSAELNKAKDHAAADGWLPPRPSRRAAFVAVQIEVKAAWNLAVTPAERDAMARVLDAALDAPGALAPRRGPKRPARHQ